MVKYEQLGTDVFCSFQIDDGSICTGVVLADRRRFGVEQTLILRIGGERGGSEYFLVTKDINTKVEPVSEEQVTQFLNECYPEEISEIVRR
ncbi:MAG: hypothetical protein KatS3mg023_0580 [Armatimonadota bacterium]|nr:MAG: hypothetical protein KatS3mg023_0580 [Armatimonadota bacterium]